MASASPVLPSPTGPDCAHFITLSLSARGHVLDVARDGILLGRIVGDGARALTYVITGEGQRQVGSIHPGFPAALRALLSEVA